MNVDFPVATQTVTYLDGAGAEQTQSLSDWLDNVDEADLRVVKRGDTDTDFCGTDLRDVAGQPTMADTRPSREAEEACAFVAKGDVYVIIPRNL